MPRAAHLSTSFTLGCSGRGAAIPVRLDEISSVCRSRSGCRVLPSACTGHCSSKAEHASAMFDHVKGYGTQLISEICADIPEGYLCESGKNPSDKNTRFKIIGSSTGIFADAPSSDLGRISCSTSSISDVIVSLFPRGLTLALRSERQDDDFGRGASVMPRIAVPS
jgi:hypothetical protein